MNNRTFFIISIIVVVVLVVISYMTGYRQASKDITTEHVTDTIRLTDTMWVTAPADTVTLVQWKAYHITDTAIVTHHDTTVVFLPYEQHHFAMPDTLDLWYSGVDARIDSLRFLMTSSIITNTITLKETPRQNTIGVAAGFDDISLFYLRRVGRVNVGLSAGYTYDRKATARGVVGWSF